MRSIFFSTLLCFFTVTSFSQNYSVKNLSITKHVDGTLLLPEKNPDNTLVIIIPGSGPIDRDGNQNLQKSNAIKKLAEGLSSRNLATFRFDKRVVKQIRSGNIDPNTKFDDFVIDGVDIVRFFSDSNQFDKIYLIGHSQGSLVGMLTARETAISGFISLAGAGNSIDVVIVEQIKQMAPGLAETSANIFARIAEGELVEDYPPALASVFNTELQPFIANWMQYDPKDIIALLSIPILIVNGTKDLQVSLEEASLLHQANKNSQLEVIENMNHILVNIEGDRLENSKSYNEPKRPLSSSLIESLITFIKAN